MRARLANKTLRAKLGADSLGGKMAINIIKVLKDQRLQSRLGLKSREYVRKYHWREIAKQYLDVYQEALQLSGNTIM